MRGFANPSTRTRTRDAIVPDRSFLAILYIILAESPFRIRRTGNLPWRQEDTLFTYTQEDEYTLRRDAIFRRRVEE